MSPLLEVRALTKHFPARERGSFLRAVDGVSFELERGQALGLVGESGSGKSTTARCIVGLERASSGSVRFDGTELTTLSERAWFPFRRRVQIVFQDPYASLDPRQSALDIVEEPRTIHRIGKPRERRLHALGLIEAVGLSSEHAGRYPHEFSGGQRQRIGIARALALEPELLVLDEPVSALDVSIQAGIVNLLSELRLRLGLSYLFIAHDLAVVRHVCDDVAVMYLGRIVERARRDELFARPAHPYTQALLSAVPIADPALERARERMLLEGEPPSPLAPPAGCAFHPRCPARARVPADLCRTRRPELGVEAHKSACHLVEQEARRA